MSNHAIPLVDVSGTSRECGRAMGRIWRDVLRKISTATSGRSQWWREKAFSSLTSKYVPHIPDLYEGMAEGARVASRKLVIPIPPDLFGGCTSFAVAASHTVHSRLICGQTKDTPLSRLDSYQVLKLQPSDAPATLTLTYPGMLFGHGFAKGGCAIFRNSLLAGHRTGGRLPYDVWGLLALHCSRIDDAVAILERFGVDAPFHCMVCDSRGRIAGIEHGKGGTVVLHAHRGIHVHANHVLAGPKLARFEKITRAYSRSSHLRQQNLDEALRQQGKHLTPQLAFAAMSSHKSFPMSVCNHQSKRFCTSAAIVAEPASGRLWVTAGPPCAAWPVEYELDQPS